MININKLEQYLYEISLPLALLIIAIWELRIEIRILLDSFTFTALFYCLISHPLAVIALFIAPALFRKKMKGL